MDFENAYSLGGSVEQDGMYEGIKTGSMQSETNGTVETSETIENNGASETNETVKTNETIETNGANEINVTNGTNEVYVINETNEINGIKGTSEIKEIKETSEIMGIKETSEIKEIKEINGIKAASEINENKDTSEINGTNEISAFNENKETIESNKTNRIGEPSKTNNTNEINEPSDTNKTNGINEPSETNKTNGIDEPSETNKTNGIIEPSETNKANGINEPSETNKTNGINEPSETNKPNGINEPSETNKTNGINEPSETNKTNGINDPSETNKTNGINEPSETNKTNEINEPSETNKTNGINEPSETKKTNGFNELSETNKTNGSNEPSETKKTNGINELSETNKTNRINESNKTNKANEINGPSKAVNVNNSYVENSVLKNGSFKSSTVNSGNTEENAKLNLLNDSASIITNVRSYGDNESNKEIIPVITNHKQIDKSTSENKDAVNFVYAYVTKTPNNNVCTNNELIHLEIILDKKNKTYRLKKHITKLPFLRYGHFLCLTNNDTILAIGGTDGKKKFKIVEEFCEQKKKWQQINIMHFARSNFCGICTEENNLIILGGEGEQNILRSVEYFDSKINTWINLPPLIDVRHSASAVILNNSVFVIGGKDGSGKYGKIHKSVEMLNLNEKQKKWVLCDFLKQARLNLATIVFKEKIYAIGGHSGVKNLNSVEIYDAEKNCWESGPKLNIARSCLVAFIWNDNLVVYGGVNEHKGGFINSVEILDEKTSTWVLLKEQVG